MFEYFEDNYPWNLAIVTALEMGAVASDIDTACRKLRSIPKDDVIKAILAWADAWSSLGERLFRQAQSDEAGHHYRSAGEKYLRGSLYYLMAERPLTHKDSRKKECYQKGISMFRKGVELRSDSAEFVEIPYGNSFLPAVFVKAQGNKVAPCIINFNGFDWIKEFNYFLLALDNSRRGFSSLFCDQPGSGGALRLHGITAELASEKPAAACIDYLETRRDVDRNKIGIHAASLGGYYAPRAAAFEKRLSFCAVSGAFYDGLDVMRMRAEKGKDYAQSVPDADDQVMWVTGCDSMAGIMDFLAKTTLKGVAEHIQCPLLIIHGGADRQIPINHGQLTYDAAINSPNRKLVVLGQEDGGIEHCSIDNFPLVREITADWISDMLKKL
ncbi:MAG: hypothetical protein A3E87_05400 [Gammaproteobacteria bacterium RIFCSPHIGHO2_12_FULL_35_23]|nr:MAG: hypothetical protein A3E87_05400 [Gammaproteobacteria bacterium RIFCSPHIGHO2_12_FULL_35_23]